MKTYLWDILDIRVDHYMGPLCNNPLKDYVQHVVEIQILL